MSMLALSGWAQPANALSDALPHAQTFDYSDYPHIEASFDGLRAFAGVEHVVGWSLGGQLALRAIAAGVLKPKRLTLVAAPYQFVSGNGFSGGMDPVTFQQFRDNYARDANRTKQRFHALIAKGDAAPRQVLEQLGHHPEVENTTRWLPWLEQLGASGLRGFDLSMVPPTLIVHGDGDAIAPLAQGEALAAHLPHAVLERWEGTGHAPHLRDKLRFEESIHQHGKS